MAFFEEMVQIRIEVKLLNELTGIAGTTSDERVCR
jgi:hypothetical protein